MSKIKEVANQTDLMQAKEKEKMTTKEGFDLTLLNPKELRYFRMIYPKSGVLFLTSEPGIAKSATMRSIAKKLKMKYIDLRLAMLDETDVGLFPDKFEVEVFYPDGTKAMEKFLDHIVPRWAHIANQQPTLIHFEELNRAPLAVRNAALQILLEREIGYNFAFNENVLMVATGNLGEEDGTDVEEFDSALNGRLIHYKHKLSMDEWFEYYANEHVNKMITRYLTAHPDHYYIGKNQRSEKDKSYACPRTWTFLSDYINRNYGSHTDVTEWLDDIVNVGHSYIGSINTQFVRYLRDSLKLSIQDIINRYPQIQKEGVKFTRDKKSELLSDLRTQDLSKLKDNQTENVKKFLLDIGEDEVTAFLVKILDEDYQYTEDEALDEKNNQFILDFLRDPRFRKFEKVMLSYVQTDKKDEKDDFWNKKK